MSENQLKLRELENTVRISGILKEVNLEVKPNKKDPTVKQIMGNIVVIVEDKVRGVIHEHEVNLFAKETSKLYKGYVTVMNEYKPADKFGLENASLVTVTGSLDENKYLGNDGLVKQFNRIRGLFVNRVESLEKHEALAQMEIVITSLANNEVIVNGVPETTEELKLSGLTVGYNNTVSKIHNIIVPANLASVISENYQVGNTGKLTFEIVNYAEEVKAERDPLAASEGFGLQVELTTVNKYYRNFTVVGGFPPYYDERAVSEEHLVFMNQIRNLAIDEIKNSTPATPPVTQQGMGGFGVNGDPFAAGKTPVQISEDDLPF